MIFQSYIMKDQYVTERVEGLGQNVVISNFDWEKVMNFIENYKGKQTKFQDVKISPCQLIVNYLKKYQN